MFRDTHLTRVTHDHTYVQRLVDEGSLAEDDAPFHPWRNLVLRSIDGNVAEGGDVSELVLEPGDRVLLASDGLTDLVSERHVELLLERHHDDSAAELLLDAALAAGGRDNVSCLLATVVDGAPVLADGALVGAVRNPHNIVDAAAVRMPHSA